MPVITAPGRQRQINSQGSLTSQRSLLRLFLKNDTAGLCLASTCTYAATGTQTNNIHIRYTEKTEDQ